MANLTFNQLQNIITELTFRIKNLDYNSTNQAVQKLVRRAYEQESQPFNNINDDTTYFWFTIKDDPTNELYDVKREYVQAFDDLDNLIYEGIQNVIHQARVIEVVFIFYGDLAFDSSQNARLRLLNDDIYRFLKTYDVYLRREVGAVDYTYENIQNRWWKRASFSATFNLSVESLENINNLTQVNANISSFEIVDSIIIKEE